MIIFPAVDLQDGKAVRLKQGKANESTYYGDALEFALKWQEMGAQYLHLIDLDGAFDGYSANAKAVEQICSTLTIPVQLGGGIRSKEHAQYWFDKGVTRLIIGTMALEEPDKFKELCQSFSGKIGLSLDAYKNVLKTRGWVEDSKLSLEEVLPRVEKDGAAFLIYTDIERDGMQTGFNFDALEKLAKLTTLPLIAAGGLATIEDVQKIHTLTKNTSFVGAITGRAIYEGSLDLKQALTWIEAQNQ